MSSEQSGKILSTVYEKNHEEIALNYLLKFKDMLHVKSFVNSTAFSKLGITEIEKQFKAQDMSNKAILDLATSKEPEFLNLLLDCDNCFKILPDEEKIDVLTNRNIGSEYSPLGLIVDSNNFRYLKVLFDSNAIAEMSTSHINTLMCFIKDNSLGGTAMTMSKITHNPEKLIGFITSRTFQNLDQEHQISLVGEKLLTKVQACLVPEENSLSDYYNITCVGQAIQEID